MIEAILIVYLVMGCMVSGAIFATFMAIYPNHGIHDLEDLMMAIFAFVLMAAFWPLCLDIAGEATIESGYE